MTPAAVLLVALGGAAGAVARYLTTLFFVRFEVSVPLGTLASNLAGCFLLGLFLQLGAGTLAPSHGSRLLVATGFCGGYTTLSALVFELHAYLREANTGAALAYLSATLFGALLSFVLGLLMARLLMR